MTRATAVALLAAVWIGSSVLGGAILAALARRIHPGLNYRRLWLVYAALLGFTVAVVMIIAWW